MGRGNIQYSAGQTVNTGISRYIICYNFLHLKVIKLQVTGEARKFRLVINIYAPSKISSIFEIFVEIIIYDQFIF